MQKIISDMPVAVRERERERELQFNGIKSIILNKDLERLYLIYD